jgi:hypothetical protein
VPVALVHVEVGQPSEGLAGANLVGEPEAIGFTLAVEAIEQQAGLLHVNAAPEVLGRMLDLPQEEGGRPLPPRESGRAAAWEGPARPTDDCLQVGHAVGEARHW